MKFPVKLYFCMITHNRAKEALEVVKNVYPYVDRCIIIDGGSTDGTIGGLRAIAGSDYVIMDYEEGRTREVAVDVKMNIVIKPWCDDFPNQRNAYLETVGLLRKENESSWVVVSDSDEYLSERFRIRLKKVVEEFAEPNGYTMLLIRARDVELDEEGNKVHERVPDYWKNLVYKWRPKLRIVGEKVHEGFNMNFNMVKLPDNIDKGPDYEILYEHRKRGNATVWERAHTRNFFIGGGGPNLGEKQRLWKPYRELLDPLLAEFHGIPEEDLLWHHYRDYLKAGNVDRRIKYWLIRYMLEGVKDRPRELTFEDNGGLVTMHLQKSDTEVTSGYNYDGASEIREGYKYYFRILHPDEEPEELKGISIP